MGALRGLASHPVYQAKLASALGKQPGILALAAAALDLDDLAVPFPEQEPDLPPDAPGPTQLPSLFWGH